jgi:hypothetical protein
VLEPGGGSNTAEPTPGFVRVGSDVVGKLATVDRAGYGEWEAGA